MDGAGPIDALAAGVAAQALAGLLLDRRVPLFGEADDLGLVLGVGDVQGTIAVAGLANRFFGVVARVFAEYLGVLGVAERDFSVSWHSPQSFSPTILASAMGSAAASTSRPGSRPNSKAAVATVHKRRNETG